MIKKLECKILINIIINFHLLETPNLFYILVQTLTIDGTALVILNTAVVIGLRPWPRVARLLARVPDKELRQLSLHLMGGGTARKRWRERKPNYSLPKWRCHASSMFIGQRRNFSKYLQVIMNITTMKIEVATPIISKHCWIRLVLHYFIDNYTILNQ